MILNGYVDICTGSLSNVLDGCKEFTQSRGRRNPQETMMCWKADIDMGIDALNARCNIWADEATNLTPSRIIQISRSNLINGWQRSIISLCILHDCQQGDCDARHNWRPVICPNYIAIGRLKKICNGTLIHDKTGRFANSRTNSSATTLLDKIKMEVKHG